VVASVRASGWRFWVLVVLAALAGSAGCRHDPYCPDALSGCPATMPTVGAPCRGISPSGGCEYGDDPSHACNTIFVCDAQAGWSVDNHYHQPSCPTMLGPLCPATFAEAQTAACDAMPTNSPTCTYPEGTCRCSSGQATFTCTPPAAPGCPSARPRTGTPCSGSCTWGAGTCDYESAICACGVWQLVQCLE
jgi:hypothetical protein